MTHIFTNKKFIIALLLISITMALLSLIDRQIGTDDAWFAEESYWFEKNGYVRSDLFDGLNQFGEQHLAYHRLHVWQGALMIKLYGWSAYAFKSILLIYFIIFLLATYTFFKRNDIFYERSQYLIFYSLVIAYSLIINLSFSNRPDIMVMAFGFLSFRALYPCLQSNQYTKLALSALFAGLAALTHLNGLVFIAAGAVLLLFNKKYRPFFHFLIISGLVCLIYFVIFDDVTDIQLYLQQMQFNPALKHEDFSVVGVLLKLVNSYIPYFHKGSDSSYTLLFLATCIWQRKKIFNNEITKNIFIYFIAIALSLALISPGFKDLYLVYHAPYAFMLIALLYKDMFTLTKVKKNTFIVLLCLFFLTQWGEVAILTNKKTPGMAEMHADVSQSMGIERGDRIVAPITFVFNEIDNFNIKVLFAYFLIFDQEIKNMETAFFKLAQQDKRKFIILTAGDMNDLKINNPIKGQRFDNYVYLGMYGPYHGFKYLVQAL